MSSSTNSPAFPNAKPLSSTAIVVNGQAHNGKACRVVDNTGTVPMHELQQLLAQLINEKRFGLSGRSLSGDTRIRIGEPDFTHMQIGDTLYRFILFPYEARIEAF